MIRLDEWLHKVAPWLDNFILRFLFCQWAWAREYRDEMAQTLPEQGAEEIREEPM